MSQLNHQVLKAAGKQEDRAEVFWVIEEGFHPMLRPEAGGAWGAVAGN